MCYRMGALKAPYQQFSSHRHLCYNSTTIKQAANIFLVQNEAGAYNGNTVLLRFSCLKKDLDVVSVVVLMLCSLHWQLWHIGAIL